MYNSATWNPSMIQRYHGGVSSMEYNRSGPVATDSSASKSTRTLFGSSEFVRLYCALLFASVYPS